MSIEKELFDLKNELVKMATFVENNIRDTYRGLKEKDLTLLKQVAMNDKKTDDLEKEIGDHAEHIAEWVIYEHTGTHPYLKKDDEQ